ncbi:MAG: VacJ family lipoprotein [Syntrophus sp. (in: bacteria)]
MKSYLVAVALCIVLAAGCAHKPAVVSDPAPSAATPPAQQVMAAKAEQTPALSPDVSAKAVSGNLDDYQDVEDSDKGREAEKVAIADPLEPFNRAMYHFNDKLYFWVLKPVAQGYSKVVPESARVGVSNFYTNLSFPIRFVNSLLQANFAGAASELGRFIINTVWGIGGIMDPASSNEINLSKQTVDFGQTLGVYGVGQGFYIHWPLLGPSSPRDTLGTVGDIFLYPSIYFGPWYVWAGSRVYERVNDTSLQTGDYETMKEAAIDPYVAVRDAYFQYRLKIIKHKGGPPPPGVKGLLEND